MVTVAGGTGRASARCCRAGERASRDETAVAPLSRTRRPVLPTGTFSSAAPSATRRSLVKVARRVLSIFAASRQPPPRASVALTAGVNRLGGDAHDLRAQCPSVQASYHCGAITRLLWIRDQDSERMSGRSSWSSTKFLRRRLTPLARTRAMAGPRRGRHQPAICACEPRRTCAWAASAADVESAASMASTMLACSSQESRAGRRTAVAYTQSTL
jgi:hypothetical protein